MNFQISVIVPVYNAERYIRRAVASAVHLSEVGEVILVDDAGPDNSFAICQQLEQDFSKVKLLCHPDHGNHGAGASRNVGIRRSQFEFIAFLDADDYYLPHRFTKDREILTQDPAIDGVYGAIGVKYESDEAREKFLDAGYAYQEFLTLTGVVPPGELIEVLFHCHPRITGEFSTIALTVRKSLFDRTGLFNENLRLRQDIHLWRKMATIGRLAAGSIHEPVAMRGVHGANRMTNREEQAKYVDYWWRDLETWFRNTSEIPKRARGAFSRAYCEYRVKNRPKFDGYLAFLSQIINSPSLIFHPMGFFDLNLFELCGRNWFTLHFTSAKNRMICALKTNGE